MSIDTYVIFVVGMSIGGALLTVYIAKDEIIEMLKHFRIIKRPK
jgi:hypothetical protein